MWGCALAWEIVEVEIEVWKLKIARRPRLGNWKSAEICLTTKKSDKCFKSSLSTQETEIKWFKVHSSIINAKCNHWAPKTGLQLKRGGDQLAICKGCKVQKVIYCVCQSLKKRLCTAFSLSWFYVHLLILIFFYENCSSWLSWQASNHFLFFLFFSFLFLPISMSECLWSLECAQNPDWKDSISFL